MPFIECPSEPHWLPRPPTPVLVHDIRQAACVTRFSECLANHSIQMPYRHTKNPPGSHRVRHQDNSRLKARHPDRRPACVTRFSRPLVALSIQMSYPHLKNHAILQRVRHPIFRFPRKPQHPNVLLTPQKPRHLVSSASPHSRLLRPPRDCYTSVLWHPPSHGIIVITMPPCDGPRSDRIQPKLERTPAAALAGFFIATQ